MTEIEENIPHEVSEVICLKCLFRWMAVYPAETQLKKLECRCGEVGYVIKTGQTLPDIPNEEMLNDVRYKNMERMWGKEVAMRKYKEFCGGESE